MRSKLRASTIRGGGTSSIYWDSVDSSGGSSGSAGSRNYVDPWDLENYAYLRRHSVAAATQPIYQTTSRYGTSRLSRSSHVEPDYWYAASAVTREPGYDAPASVEEIYFRPGAMTMPRALSTAAAGYYHHQHHQRQPVYEEHYAAPSSLYDPLLSELEQAAAFEELRTREMLRRQSKTARTRNYSRGEECYYHSRPSEMLLAAEATLARSRRRHVEELMEVESPVDEVEVATRYHHATLKPSHMTLGTYGHLKIDYTNSWNSLHRKIASK